MEESIKDSERKLRGAVDSPYTITGPDQKMRPRVGRKCWQTEISRMSLGSSCKKSGSKILPPYFQWKNCHRISWRRLLSVSTRLPACNSYCYQTSSSQSNHEEADTLIAIHANKVTARHVVVRASDTDVLVILVGSIGQRPEVRSMTTLIMYCGMGNTRRFINVSNIAEVLEETSPGIPQALPGFHAFTGSDYTSAFYR